MKFTVDADDKYFWVVAGATLIEGIYLAWWKVGDSNPYVQDLMKNGIEHVTKLVGRAPLDIIKYFIGIGNELNKIASVTTHIELYSLVPEVELGFKKSRKEDEQGEPEKGSGYEKSFMEFIKKRFPATFSQWAHWDHAKIVFRMQKLPNHLWAGYVDWCKRDVDFLNSDLSIADVFACHYEIVKFRKSLQSGGDEHRDGEYDHMAALMFRFVVPSTSTPTSGHAIPWLLKKRNDCASKLPLLRLQVVQTKAYQLQTSPRRSVTATASKSPAADSAPSTSKKGSGASKTTAKPKAKAARNKNTKQIRR